MKEFISKWSNWWILAPKRKQLDDAFEKELNELIEREVALRIHDVSGWVSVDDRLPETLEIVWVSDGKGWTTLGCRSDYYECDDGKLDWCWAALLSGNIEEEGGVIVDDFIEDDWNVRFWHTVPLPPIR